MIGKTFLFRCYCCSLDTEATVDISQEKSSNSDTTIESVHYCQFCKSPNVIRIPERWDSSGLVLEIDSFLGYEEGIPVFQGSKE